MMRKIRHDVGGGGEGEDEDNEADDEVGEHDKL